MSKSNNKGFTLIEVLVVLAISAVVMTAVFTAQVSINRHSARAMRDIESSANLNTVKAMILNDIRECGISTEDVQNCTSGSNSTSLIIRNNSNATYEYHDNSLWHGSDPNNPLLPDVKSVNFQYFHPDGTSDNDVTNIKTIEFNICDNNDKCINSNVKIRNFR